MLTKEAKNELKNSQNFLHNKNLVYNLLEKSNISKKDTVIEIGPGRGIITAQLAEKCDNVYAVEYDPYLYEGLKKRFRSVTNVKIEFGDFLDFTLPKKQKYKVFSSIPYNITSAILHKLLYSYNPPEDTYLIIQKEAAKKYTGSPYNKESMRALLLKPYFNLDIICNIERTDFKPVPSVSSVLLNISKREYTQVNKNMISLYNDFIAYVFSRSGNIQQRCRLLFTAKQLRRLAKDIGFRLTDSPAYINYQKWLKVFQYYCLGVSSEKQRLTHGAYSKLLHEQRGIDKIHRSRK